MPGEERGRNEIQVGGGYSGLEGAFFNGVYSTRNFLGRGQIVSAALQVGGRSNRYQSVVPGALVPEPALPVRLQHLPAGPGLRGEPAQHQSRRRPRPGAPGRSLGQLQPRLSTIETCRRRRSWSPPRARRTATSITTENKISSITPVYGFSTVNNPYRPSGGKALTVSFQVAGGPLGGDTSFLKPIVRVHELQAGLPQEFPGASRRGRLGARVAGRRAWSAPRTSRACRATSDSGSAGTRSARECSRHGRSPRCDTWSWTKTGNIIDVLGDPRYHRVGRPGHVGRYPGAHRGRRRPVLPVPVRVRGSLNEQADLAFFFDVG